MKVNFYNFAKRANSTKQPAGSGTEHSCSLKDNTSMHDPVILVNGSPNVSYTYAYIQDWGKYYFVTDMVSVANGLTEYHLREDSMASNKSLIAATYAHIAFASSGYDTMLPDPRIAVSNSRKVYTAPRMIDNTSIFSQTGTYILTVFAGSIGKSLGVSASYAMQQSTMNRVKEWLGNDTVMASLSNYFNGTPLDAIFGCIWLPISYSSIPGTSVTDLVFGNHTASQDGITGISAKLLEAPAIFSGSKSITIPRRYTDFRQAAPYTSMSLHLPGIGMVDVNASDLIGDSSIDVTYDVDCVSGDMLYRVMRNNNNTADIDCCVQTIRTNIATQCPLGQMITNAAGGVSSMTGAVGGAVSFAAGMMSGNGLAIMGGAAALIGSASSSCLNFNRRSVSLAGGIGSQLASVHAYIYLVEVSLDTEDPDDATYIATKGRPYGKCNQIGNIISGFVCCDGASIEITGNSQERAEINEFLNNGFFLE